MTKPFKPLLAAPYDAAKIDLTDNLYVASPKLDGIRAIVIDGVVVSRSLKPIPNKHVQALFGHLEGLDGELIVGSPTAPDCYNKTNSAVMSRDGEPYVTFHVFDEITHPDFSYGVRRDIAAAAVQKNCTLNVVLVPQISIHHPSALLKYEAAALDLGYEGVMLRRYDAAYKFGRGTAKCGTLLKVKRMASEEAEVLGFEEEMENLNEATVNALGYTERSSHASNKVGKGRLGALVCQTLAGSVFGGGVEFRIGTGFNAEQRQEIWEKRSELVNQLVTFNHFPVGAKDAPRFPSFKGFRSEIDL